MILLFLIVTTTVAYTPNLSLYKSTADIYKDLKRIESENTNIFKVHQCPQDDRVWYVTIGKQHSKTKAIVTCGVHARQLITSDTCMSIINQIIENKEQYKNLYLIVVPIVNTNRQKVLKGETCVRVNQNAVDPNRNFPIEFQFGNKINGSETYQGPHPLSEKSSKCIQQILSMHHYNLFIDIHTGQFSIFYAQNLENPKFNKTTRNIAFYIKRNFCPHCITTTVKNQHGRIAGEMFEYASKVKKVDYAFLLEMFGGKYSYRMMGKYKGCMKEFNPNSERIRDYYIDMWTNIVKQMIDKVILERQGKSQGVKPHPSHYYSEE